MFHALALVKIKYGGTEQFFKSFFQVTFVDCYFAAKFLDGDRLTDMLNKDFPGFDDLVPVCFVGKELTVDGIYFLFTQHAVQTVQEQHLRLGIDIDIFQAVGVRMVKYTF